ncbi:hypothetical protein BANRA_04986 [Escherichia coli]|nr:hypothetical protein BANRA_04986 [Escherichia coli]
MVHFIDGNVSRKKSVCVTINFKIPPQMKLIIAIFGLKIDYCEYINSEKLCCLLNKYDFFNDEIFLMMLIQICLIWIHS